MTKITQTILAAAATCFLALPASATVLYSEAVSGDLTPNSAPTAPTFDAVLGDNTVLGRWEPTPTTDGNADNFNIRITNTLEVVSVSISFTTLANGEEITLGLRDASTNLSDDDFNGTFAGGSSGATASLVDTFDAGTGVGPLTRTNTTYEFYTIGGTIFGPAFNFPNIDWTVTLVTREKVLPPPPNEVPLPAGMPLLLAGLGGLAILRRRKRSA